MENTKNTILAHGLIPPGSRVLCGVSGGADSTALLLVLRELSGALGFSLCAAHLNHCIRGEAADGDQRYVEELCGRLNVALRVERLDVPGLARSRGKTLEQAARDGRYGFFAQAAKEFGAGRTAVAHHMEDQAESIMLHLIRGTGLLGLCGMKYRRGDVIRPFLDARRGEIEGFLKERGVSCRTDATNFDRAASRNRIRLDIIPYIEENLNGNFVAGLCSAGELLRRDEEYLSGEARRALDACRTPEGCDRAKLNSLPLPILTRAIRMALEEAGASDVERKHVEQVAALLTAPTGAQTCLPGTRAYVSYGSLRFGAPPETQAFRTPFIFPGKTRLPSGFFVAELVKGDIIKQNAVGYMDADKLPAPLTVRPRMNGDRFFPLGAPGARKLKDFFIDRKVPREERLMPILFCGNEALFIPGWGVSERVRVTGATRRILRVRYTAE